MVVRLLGVKQYFTSSFKLESSQPSAVRGRAQEREHVVAGGAVDELRRNGAVFIGLEPTALDELVCNGSSTDGVFEVELVFPARCKDEYIDPAPTANRRVH